MKKKKSAASRSMLRRAIENKGFYIALFSLMVLVGFSIYARRLQSGGGEVSFDDEAWQEAVQESGIDLGKDSEAADRDLKIGDTDTAPKQATDQQAESTVKAEPAKKPAAAEHDMPAAVETMASAASAESADKPFSMQMPCGGKVIAACSVDDLVYCKAMDDWRTHNGTDIAAAEGDSVKAAADGVVSQVYEDDLLGVVVVLDHGNGISSLYGNLQSYDFIRTGTQVRAGDIIGGVGKPGALEKELEPHLHFEVIKDGEYHNPSEFMN